MSISVGTGMAIAGAVSAATAGGTAVANGKLNKKNRKWQEKMYARQLQDERDNWNMVNAYNEEMYNKYNSPAAQARQMLQAGLNPDLQDISSSGLPQSGDVSASGVPSVSGQSPFDFVGAFANVMDILQGLESNRLDNAIKQQQLDAFHRSKALDYLVKTYNPRTLDGFSSESISEKDLITHFRELGLSRSAARSAAHYVGHIDYREVQDEYYKRSLGAETSRGAFLKTVSDPRYSSFDDVMQSSLQEFMSSLDKLDSAVRRANKSKADYDASYYGSKSGSGDAALDTEKSQLDFDAAKARSAKSRELDEVLKDIHSPLVRIVLRSLYSKLVGD